MSGNFELVFIETLAEPYLVLRLKGCSVRFETEERGENEVSAMW